MSSIIKNIKHLTAFSILASLLCTQPLMAQVRRSVASAKPTAAKVKCSGAWTGIVVYTRTQNTSDNKSVQRVSGRGQDTRDWQMKYNYSARVAVIERPEQNGSSTGKATINHNFSSTEKVHAVEKNSCDRGKTWREMSGDSTSQTETTGTATVDANVNVGVNSDGTYTVSVALPQIAGQTAGSTSSTYSGQCTAKEGKSLSLPPVAATIDGNSLTSDGSHRVNPDDPNRLSGTFTNSWQGVTETITWSLQKCGAPLRIIDLKFEEMKFPKWNDWAEVPEQKGTTDGNLVKIRATVLNASGETRFADLKIKETFKGDKWDGAKPDGLLEGGDISVRLGSGEQKEVEMVWDSSGYAWYDDGRPRYVQRIRTELEEGGKKVDELVKNLKVAPKPVVLVHGLWSNWTAWESWQNILTTTHSYDWKAYPVGERPEKGVMNTGGAFLSTDPTNSIFENSQQLGRYIRFAQEDRNAWHVDLVAHSMGGLISRHYIHSFMQQISQDGRPQISHLVMLGTPNMGSPCADVMDLAFDALGKRVEAVRQLRQDAAEEFNRVVTDRKGVKFSVLAGNPLPTMCKSIVWNDGVVPVPSAIWKIKDNAISPRVHTELTGTADFSAFVKPRLAIGPKGNHLPESLDIANLSASQGEFDADTRRRNVGVSFAQPLSELDRDPNQEDKLFFAKLVKIAPKQLIKVELPVEAGLNLGVTFMADPSVSVQWLDAAGTIVGKNTAGTPDSALLFRSMFYDKSTAPGMWQLHLENTSNVEREVVIAGWKDARK